MNALIVAIIVFTLTTLGGYIGTRLRVFLPNEHFSSSAVDVIKLSIGLIATITALIMSLTISSAKKVFDSASDDTATIAVSIIMLDHDLAQYGKETDPIRQNMQMLLDQRFKNSGNIQVTQPNGERIANVIDSISKINLMILGLSPQTSEQVQLKNKIAQNFDKAVQARWTLLSQGNGTIPPLFLSILTFWLVLIFVCFGLCADENLTVFMVKLFCSLSVSMAIFLVIELESPLSGFIKVSDAPIHYMFDNIGKH